MIKVSDEEFNIWSNLIFQFTGIVISDQKRYLIENRLSELVSETGSKNFTELYNKVRHSGDDEIRKQVINRISTQETSFFRDPHVFNAFRRVLLEETIQRKRETRKLRIWSAACATGQEPYTIAMILNESIPDLDRWDVSIIATDLADNAFRKASLGRYTQLEVRRGLDTQHLARYFSARPDNLWQIRDSLRALVSFRKLNLVADDFRTLGLFDFIFCRNVAIYFDQPTKEKLFTKISGAMASDGFLLVGSAESLAYFSQILQPAPKHKVTFYVRKDGLVKP
jgi:chemotaxis protein methyltransferase CheR